MRKPKSIKEHRFGISRLRQYYGTRIAKGFAGFLLVALGLLCCRGRTRVG